jgi:signal transduction histidine kinase
LTAPNHYILEDKRYREHCAARLFGLQSCFSSPVNRSDGECFGTLCGLDLRPVNDIDLRLFAVVDDLSGLYPGRVNDTAIQPGLSLRCDPERLSQLLSNLLKNALVHGCAQHPAFIAAHVRDELFTLRVTNGGPDLHPTIMAQLLKPCWPAASRPGNEGLGLGLYILDQIARGHGGAIEVGSSAGQTSFAFALPAAGIAGGGITSR